MRKKYLSALLFGALVMASTATFTSCKDYDDDIENLQGQINSNKDAISALQKLVGEGKWVTAISPIENGFTVTMSDGTSQTVKGINGKDGKDGTQWTISEDGFWVCDGEKTAFVAVGKDGANGENGQDGQNGQDGKNGLTAPSPQISANGNWIVYNFNEATGEFEATETEFSAIGTAAYVVATGNTYELHIADQTGAYQTITLPATSDAFIATAPYSKVIVKFEKATWSKWNANNPASKTLLAQFPEIANIEKNAPVKQGGNLPLIISPANVELTDAYSFSLQSLDGKTADIQIGSPIKGLPTSTSITEYREWRWFDLNGDGNVDDEELFSFPDGDAMVTRSAENDCFWSVKIDPAYDEKTKKYAEVENASLVVANAKGTTMKTAFAYTVDCETINQDIAITFTNSEVKYASTIDVLAKQPEGANAIFTLNNEYTGYTVLEATNALQVAKYQISIDGTKLTIGNMPANETSIDITLRLTALGLNGSAKRSDEYTLKVSQGVEAQASLSEKAITLDKDKVKVRWNISELGMNAIQFNSFMAADVMFTATREEDGVKYLAYNDDIKFYNSNGDETTYYPNNGTWSDKEAATFGFDVEARGLVPATVAGYTSEKWMPKDYTITLTSKNGTSVLFSAETTLKVSNPEVATSYIKLVPGFVENGIFQITGTPAVGGTTVSYNLRDALLLDENAELIGFTDLDAWNYVNNGGDTQDGSAFGKYNWLSSTQALPSNTDEEENFMVEVNGATAINLYVNKWTENPNARATWYEAKEQQLYKTRNIRAYYKLFGNENNVVEFDFPVVVKSEIFSEDATKAIVMDDAKLTAVFGGANNTDKIDIKAAVTKAVFVAGTDKGKTYDMFGKAGGTSDATIIHYDQPKTNGDYVVDANGKPVEISHDDLLDFGVSMTDFIALGSDAKIYLKTSKYTATGTSQIWGWEDLYATWSRYYTINSTTGKEEYTNKPGTSIKWTKAEVEAELEANLHNRKERLALFNAYKSKIAFTTTPSIGGTVTAPTAADEKVDKVIIAFKDPAEAAKYFQGVADDGVVGQTESDSGKKVVKSTTITAKDNAPTDVTGGQVTVPMVIKVTDQWGMTMVREFNVTVKTN